MVTTRTLYTLFSRRRDLNFVSSMSVRAQHKILADEKGELFTRDYVTLVMQFSLHTFIINDQFMTHHTHAI